MLYTRDANAARKAFDALHATFPSPETAGGFGVFLARAALEGPAEAGPSRESGNGL